MNYIGVKNQSIHFAALNIAYSFYLIPLIFAYKDLAFSINALLSRIS